MEVSGFATSAEDGVVHGESVAQKKISFGEAFGEAESADELVALFFFCDWEGDGVGFIAIIDDKVLGLAIQGMTWKWLGLGLCLRIAHKTGFESLL